ncbi:MAG: hypothetical protein FWH10_08245 [Oscillospiraceae bacterium]|nr:hypothetical protein [Oscillospiraceae bacterium]
MKKRFFLILLALCFIFTGLLYGCSGRYFSELKAAYYYVGDNNILIKYPSQLEFEPSELLSYDSSSRKTKALEYNNLYFTMPVRDYAAGEIYDYKTAVGYAVYDGGLVFTEIPIQYAPCDIYPLAGNTDSFIASVNDDNAFLVSLPDGSAAKLFDDDNIGDYLVPGSDEKLIYAKIISVSPDGKYILYVSNRNYITADIENITEGYSNSLDLYYYDIQAGTEAKIMDFEGKEFLCWETDPDGTNDSASVSVSGNFLFRDSDISPSTGQKIHSDIRRYSIIQGREDIFLRIAEEYKSYEMLGERYIYAEIRSGGGEDSEGISSVRETKIYIFDIYSKEASVVSAGKYLSVWNLKISGSGDYIAFFGSYINADGKSIPEIVTIHLGTNHIFAHYEQVEENYYLGSFYWLPDDVLIVNFRNMTNMYKDLCRFHEIRHKGTIAANNTRDITPVEDIG